MARLIYIHHTLVHYNIVSHIKFKVLKGELNSSPFPVVKDDLFIE